MADDRFLGELRFWRWLIPGIYLAFGVAWILGGAFLQWRESVPVPGQGLEIAKGLAFVGISAGLLLAILVTIDSRSRSRIDPAEKAFTFTIKAVEQAADERRLRFRIWVALGALGSIAALFAIGGMIAIHRDTVRQAEREIRDLSLLIASHTGRELDIAANRLNDIATSLDGNFPQGGDADVRVWLKRHTAVIPGAEGTLILNRDGRSVAAYPPALIGHDMSTRPYVTVHDGETGTAVRISRPFTGLTRGKWIVGLSRPLARDARGPTGYVVVGLPAAHFANTWESAAMVTNREISLFQRDGTMLMHLPFDADRIAKNYAAEIFPDGRDIGAPLAIAWRQDSVDGADRLSAMNIVPGWPDLLVVTTRSREDILAFVRRLEFLAFGGSAILAAIALLLGGLFGLELRRRMRARTTMDALARFPVENPNPVLRLDPGGQVTFANAAAAEVIGNLPGRDSSPEWSAVLDRCAAAKVARRFLHRIGNQTFDVTVSPSAGEDTGIYMTDVTSLEEQERELRSINRSLRTLVAAGQAYPNAPDRDALLSKLCDVLRDAGGYGLVWAGKVDESRSTVTPLAFSAAEDLKSISGSRAKRDATDPQGPVAAAIETGEIAVIADIPPTRQGAPENNLLRSVAILPLRYDRQVMGIMALYGRSPAVFSPANREILNSLSVDIGFAIRSLDSVSRYDELDREYRNALGRTRETLRQMIYVLSTMVEQRDPYTAGHQRQVAELAVRIGKEMGLGHHRIESLHFGGLIHDIGKIGIPADILTRPGRLSAEEYALVQTHVKIGAEIVRDIPFDWPMTRIITEHHERMDGTGYPAGLKEDAICLEARIIGIADVVDAMISHRPYRAARPREEAREELLAGRGTRYDPAVVDACLKVLKREESGDSG